MHGIAKAHQPLGWSCLRILLVRSYLADYHNSRTRLTALLFYAGIMGLLLTYKLGWLNLQMIIVVTAPTNISWICYRHSLAACPIRFSVRTPDTVQYGSPREQQTTGANTVDFAVTPRDGIGFLSIKQQCRKHTQLRTGRITKMHSRTQRTPDFIGFTPLRAC